MDGSEGEIESVEATLKKYLPEKELKKVQNILYGRPHK